VIYLLGTLAIPYHHVAVFWAEAECFLLVTDTQYSVQSFPWSSITSFVSYHLADAGVTGQDIGVLQDGQF